MRTVNNGTMRGTRVGSGPAGEPHGRGLPLKTVVLVTSRKTSNPRAKHSNATPPGRECRVCSRSLTDPLTPPLVTRSMGEDLERVRDRRPRSTG
jgi:hypothetical protein